MTLPTVSEKYFGQAFFDDIVLWIGDNLDPDEIFSAPYLIAWIRDYFKPDEIFTDESLEDWAIKNGYVKEE